MQCLSIIIPVYNEKNTLSEVLKQINEVDLGSEFSKEIVIIDDGSTDGTRELLTALEAQKNPLYHIVFHEKNKGKGSAIRTGLREVCGEYVIIQDADLEYNPEDYRRLLDKITAHNLLVVFGSRQLQQRTNKHIYTSFYWGGVLLTWLTNILYGQHITDEATCYKMFKTSFIKKLPLTCERFEFCPEVTALTARQGVQIEEVPISYYPRSKEEGKKIKWQDGWEAIMVLLKYRFKKR